MEWVNNERYNEHRIAVINKIRDHIKDKKIEDKELFIRRLERYIYNTTIDETEISSWDVDEFVKFYNKLSLHFINNIDCAVQLIKRKKQVKFLTYDNISIIGYKNPELIINNLLKTPSHFRKKVIMCFYNLLNKHNKFKSLNDRNKLSLVLFIEKSCYDEVVNANGVEEKNWKDNDIYKYEFIVNRTLTYLNDKSVDYNLDLLNKVLNNKKINIGQITSKDAFYKLFKPIYKLVEERSNVQVKYKTSSNYTCPICKKKEVIVIGAQTRSLDEGETLYANCVKCRHKWRVS